MYILDLLKKTIGKVARFACTIDSPYRSSETFVAFLRSKGVCVGDDVHFHQLTNLNIDITRPTLLSIGDKVRLTQGLTILTHDFSWYVLLNKYDDMVGASGRVTIGNNIFIGFNCTILSGTKISDNVIIGANSVLRGEIQSDSVYAGAPAKRICSLDEFYAKRKSVRESEISAYVSSLHELYGNEIPDAMLSEEFMSFYRPELNNYDKKIVAKQLKDRQSNAIKRNQPRFLNKGEFINEHVNK